MITYANLVYANRLVAGKALPRLEYGPRHKDAGDRAGDSKTRNMHRGRSTLVAVALALALLLDGCDAKKGQGKSKKSKTP